MLRLREVKKVWHMKWVNLSTGIFEAGLLCSLKRESRSVWAKFSRVGSVFHTKGSVYHVHSSACVIFSILQEHSHYEGLLVVFRFKFKSYPLLEPKITCMTPIYHPMVRYSLIPHETRCFSCWQNKTHDVFALQANFSLLRMNRFERIIGKCVSIGTSGVLASKSSKLYK